MVAGKCYICSVLQVELARLMFRFPARSRRRFPASNDNIHTYVQQILKWAWQQPQILPLSKGGGGGGAGVWTDKATLLTFPGSLFPADFPGITLFTQYRGVQYVYLVPERYTYLPV